MKTERQIIDELGEWLCTDMERAIFRNKRHDTPPSLQEAEEITRIRYVAERIKFYRDNIGNDK